MHTLLQSRLICSPEGLHMFPGASCSAKGTTSRHLSPHPHKGRASPSSTSSSLRLPTTSGQFSFRLDQNTPTSILHSDCHCSAGQSSLTHSAATSEKAQTTPLGCCNSAGFEHPQMNPMNYSSHPLASLVCAYQTPARHKCALSLVSSE